MRRFADLHLRPDLGDMEQAQRMIAKAAELGYKVIAIPLSISQLDKYKNQLQVLCRERGVDFVSRVDIKPRTSSELTRILRKIRRKVEVVGVICDSKAVARQAAKDRRVDLLNFPADARKRFFDEAEAELASRALASLEIDISPLITLEGPPRIRLLSTLRREVATATDYGVAIVVSSGANEEMLMRKPLEVAALTMLFDMDRAQALDAISKTPMSIVERNREKLSPNFVAPGIRIIKRGNDCP
ncbi:MAG: RNase P subunit p30 family protein [Candidatus Bathyarchaeia archaeon]